MPKARRKNTSSFQRHTYLTHTTIPSQDVPFTDVAMPCEKQVGTPPYMASNEYSLSLPSSTTSVSSTSSSINNDVDIDVELMRLQEICNIYADDDLTQLELNEKKRCTLAMIHKAVFELSKNLSNISNKNISNNLKKDHPTYTSTPDILRMIMGNFGLELSQLQRSSVQTMQDTYGNAYIASMEPIPIPSLSLRELHEEIYTKPGALSYFLHLKKNVITRLRRFHLSIDDFLVVSPEVLQAQLTEDKAWYEKKGLTPENANSFIRLVQQIQAEKLSSNATQTADGEVQLDDTSDVDNDDTQEPALTKHKRCSLAMIHEAVLVLSQQPSTFMSKDISDYLQKNYPTFTNTREIWRGILCDFNLKLSQLQNSSVQEMQAKYGDAYTASIEPTPIKSLSLRELHVEIYSNPDAKSYFSNMKHNVNKCLRTYNLSTDKFLVVSPDVLQTQLTEGEAWYEEKGLTKENAQHFLALIQKIVKEKEATQVTSTTMLADAPELLIEETSISSVTSSSFGLFSPPSTTSSSFGLFSPPSVSNDHALNSSNSSLRSDYISEEKSALINEIDDLQKQFDQVIHWLNNPAELELDLFVNGSSNADLDQDMNKEALILLAHEYVVKQNLLLDQIRELDYQQKCIAITSLS